MKTQLFALSPRALHVLSLIALLLIVAFPPQPSLASIPPQALSLNSSPSIPATALTWRGTAGDGLWSNPANWDSGRVPGAHDQARFDAASPDATLDAAFPGQVGALLLETGFSGQLYLARSLDVQGEVTLAGGSLLQGGYELSAAAWQQTGGDFSGGSGSLTIYGDAHLHGGTFSTPASLMTVRSLEILAPGLLRMASNSKLNLTGAGMPLSGDGTLDTWSTPPNSIEATGDAHGDLLAVLAGLGGPVAEPAEAEPVEATAPAFAKAGSLPLDLAEAYLRTAAIDPAAGFAYFATNSTPGRVVKIRLSDFSRLGSLTFNSGENNPTSAVIDTAGGAAYFGTTTLPARLIKVDLASFTRQAALTLNQGEDNLASAVIDPAAGFAYFGTSGISNNYVIKVRLSDFSRVSALYVGFGVARLTAAVIDPTAGYAYFGTNSSPGVIKRILLSDFATITSLPLNNAENALSSAAIDLTGGFAYFGTMTSPGRLVKVRLSDFTRQGALVLPLGENMLTAGVIDSNGTYGYFGTTTTPGFVVRVRLSDLTRLDSITLSQGEDRLTSAVIDDPAGYAYFGTVTAPGIVIKISTKIDTTTILAGAPNPSQTGQEVTLTATVVDADLSATPSGTVTFFDGATQIGTGTLAATFGGTLAGLKTSTLSEGLHNLSARYEGDASFRGSISTAWQQTVKAPPPFARVDAFTLNSGERGVSAVYDPLQGMAYIGTYTTGVIVKVHLSDFSRVGALTLNSGEEKLTSAVIDTGQGFAYFGTSTSPGKVIKVRLSDFTRAGALTLNDKEDDLYAAVIDPQKDFAYFGSSDYSGTIVKVRLSDLTRVGALKLTSEYAFYDAVIDTVNGFAYFAMSYPSVDSTVLKIRLSDFTRVGQLITNSEAGHGNQYTSAAIDVAGGFAYFGAMNNPEVIKVRLSDFSHVATLNLNPPETLMFCAVIDTDKGNVYFGSMNMKDLASPARVVKVRLSDFSRVDAVTLNNGETSPGSAMIDTANGYAYFVTGSDPGKIVRVGLGEPVKKAPLYLPLTLRRAK